MPQPGVVVGRITRLVTPTQQARLTVGPGGPARSVVHLDGGGVFHFDLNDPRAPAWSYVLGELSQNNDPVYLRTDPLQGTIQEVLIPSEQFVTRLAPLRDPHSFEVEFSNSHARHLLRRQSVADQEYAQNLATLRDAQVRGTPVLVSESLDTLEILDVRAPVLPFAVAPAAAPLGGAATGVPTGFSAHPCSGTAPITAGQATMLFGVASAPACPAVAPVAPCIPFAYPVDGCWGRAHEMARLMVATGFIPCKVWCFGTLNPRTRFNSTCSVRWGWHVAPCLSVSTAESTCDQVFDPSMFTGPIDESTWLAAQNDPAVVSVKTTWDVFHWNRITGAAVFDPPPFAQTVGVLARYRGALALLATSAAGPPPYAHCPLPYPGAP